VSHWVGIVARSARKCRHSVITGSGKWVEITISAESLYQYLLLMAEKVQRCVETVEVPRVFGIEPSRPRIAPVRIVDMRSSNAWTDLAAVFRNPSGIS
jgi:hypothetical protein